MGPYVTAWLIGGALYLFFLRMHGDMTKMEPRRLARLTLAAPLWPLLLVVVDVWGIAKGSILLARFARNTWREAFSKAPDPLPPEPEGLAEAMEEVERSLNNPKGN